MAFHGKNAEYRHSLVLAKRLWPNRINREQLQILKRWSQHYRLSIAAGDLLLLENRWYVTHSGLLRLAQRRGCSGIAVSPEIEFCDRTLHRWVFRAVVYKSPDSKGFVGYGDADPSNVSSTMQGAELRIAETRAVNRALRKAYGIGLCSVEELGSASSSPTDLNNGHWPLTSASVNGSNDGQPSRLRDRLRLLIRQYNLDSNLVKTYAADFCGTETLREASRELVEAFVAHIEKEARENRDRLVCKLNSYSHPVEVQS